VFFQQYGPATDADIPASYKVGAAKYARPCVAFISFMQGFDVTPLVGVYVFHNTNVHAEVARSSFAPGPEKARDAASCHIPVLMELLPDGSTVPPRNLITTFMMKRIRNKFTQQKVLSDLEANGFWGTFDFFYMPIDPDTKANLGYAFINLSVCAVSAFQKFCDDWQIGKLGMGEHRFCRGIELVEASLQGFAANYGFYSSSSNRFKHEDPSAHPLFLREPLPGEKFTMQLAHIIRFGKKRGSDGHRPRGSGNRRGQCKYEHPVFRHQ